MASHFDTLSVQGESWLDQVALFIADGLGEPTQIPQGPGNTSLLVNARVLGAKDLPSGPTLFYSYGSGGTEHLFAAVRGKDDEVPTGTFRVRVVSGQSRVHVGLMEEHQWMQERGHWLITVREPVSMRDLVREHGQRSRAT